MDINELQIILNKHGEWLQGISGGVRANLRNADLRNADLCGANLCGAHLHGAHLHGARGLGQFRRVPESGIVIGYKRAGKCIVKLVVGRTAQRVNAIGSFKCRCDRAKVLSITEIGTDVAMDAVASDHDPKFIYKVGEIVTVSNYDPSDRVECSAGIHFFMTREEALEY